MAKGKKGKQKQQEQETNQLPPPSNVHSPEEPLEEPPKVDDDDAGRMDGFHDDRVPAKTASSVNWAQSPPATINKASAWGSEAGGGDTGWGGGWGGGGGGESGGWGNEWGNEEYEEYSEEEEEYEEQGNYPTHNANSWNIPQSQPAQPAQPAQPSWKGWGEEARRLSKATSYAPSKAPSHAPPKSALSKSTSYFPPTKPALSNSQQTQILNSLLSQPPGQNGYISTAQLQQQHKQKRKQQPAVANPYYQSQPPPKQSSTKKKKQPEDHGWGGWPEADASVGWANEPDDAVGWANEPDDAGGWWEDSNSKANKGWGDDSNSKANKGWGDDSNLRGNKGWGDVSNSKANKGWTGDDARNNSWGIKDSKANKGWTGDDARNNSWGIKDSRAEEESWWPNNAATGWGTIPEEEEEEEEEDRRVHFTPRSASQFGGWGVDSFTKSDSSRVSAANLWGSDKSKDSSYTMPSKTLTHAYKGTTTSLNTGIPRNKINEYTNIQFHDSQGEALITVEQALFGRARKAKDRIHWLFPPDKDERVESLLTWIQTVAYSLGTYGVHRFLQSRERGALITNADYRLPNGKNEPAFDWLTFDQLQDTRDKTMQESVAFYDPSSQVIVFVFLPSKSGNSVAMWRRKINVPNNMRLMLKGEVSLALAALRREEDYVVHVDEYPRPQILHTDKHGDSGSRLQRRRRASLPSRNEYRDAYPIIIDEERPGKPKKKRKWWQFFRLDWD